MPREIFASTPRKIVTRSQSSLRPLCPRIYSSRRANTGESGGYRTRRPCRSRFACGWAGGISNINLGIGDECHRGLCNKERCPRVWLNCLIRHYAADPRMPQRRSNIQTLSCSCPAPRSCSTARRRRPPSISSCRKGIFGNPYRSEEHTSELQSLTNLVCRLLLEKKKKERITIKQYIT